MGCRILGVLKDLPESVATIHLALNQNPLLPDEAAGGDRLHAGDDAAAMENHGIEQV